MISLHEFHVLQQRTEMTVYDPRYLLSSAKNWEDHTHSLQSAVPIHEIESCVDYMYIYLDRHEVRAYDRPKACNQLSVGG